MPFRVWLFVAGLLAVAAVLAAAHGAHALNSYALFPSATKIYDTAQLYHILHAIALFGIAILFAATDGRRTGWSSIMLNLAAIGFIAGIAMFSGGIYYQVLSGVKSSTPIVPVGGVSFMIGWAALALSAFGYRSAN